CRLLMRLPAPSDHCYFYFYCLFAASPCSEEFFVVATSHTYIRDTRQLKKLCRAGRVCPGFLRPIQSSGTALETLLPETPCAAKPGNGNAPVKTLLSGSACPPVS